MASHYEILQVVRGASAEVIRASYYALSERFRPDGSEPREEAERMTLLLNEAFATLIDPAKRVKYDLMLDEVFAPARKPAPHAPVGPQPAPTPSTTTAAPISPSVHDQPNLDLDAKVDSIGSGAWSWWRMLPMIFIIGWGGKIGAAIFGGIFGVLLGTAFGGLVYWLGSKTWTKSHSLGKGALVVGSLVYLVVGSALDGAHKKTKTTLLEELATQPSTAQVAPQPATSAVDLSTKTTADSAPALPAAGSDYLQYRISTMTKEQFSAGSAYWLSFHSAYNSQEWTSAISSNLQQVVNQYPAIALGPALDMALQRSLAAGQVAAAQGAQTQASSNRYASESRRTIDNADPGFVRAENESFARMASGRNVKSQSYPKQNYASPNYATTQAQIDAKNTAARAVVEESSKGNTPGAYKRYDYKTGRDIWVDANGVPLN